MATRTFYTEESVIPARDYALEDLNVHLERARSGEIVTFMLYCVGGQGQVYDAEKIRIMREFISLGSIPTNGRLSGPV